MCIKNEGFNQFYDGHIDSYKTLNLTIYFTEFFNNQCEVETLRQSLIQFT